MPRLSFFFFNDTATTEIYTLSLHDALPIYAVDDARPDADAVNAPVLRIDLGDLLVAILVRAVERVHGAVAFVHRPVGRDRARIGEPLDPQPASRLENIHRADDVHLGSRDRVGLAERHLQRREVDDRAGARRFEDTDHGRAV